ncbi:MAG: SdiA-regulated domain-containing protein [Chitinophagaceae bacterium]|nr:SdiA-regulated domain-containing protein [Chitinophagaceae bacterium]
MMWSPKSPNGYVLPRPEKIFLDKKLNEISGLFYDKNTNNLLAISDDKRHIYRLTPEGKESELFNKEFGPSADYEDLTMVGQELFVLISSGTIVEITKNDSGFSTKAYPFWSTARNDFETLYYDSAANSLVMLCKQCADEKGKHVRTAYRFDLSTHKFDTSPLYTINEKEVQDKLKDGRVELKPSAAAIHPLQKRLYILSSAGHLLLITDLKGKVQEVYRLNPTFYPQAEGIAFAPNGDMYISNEAKLGKPTLLKLNYKPEK